MSYSISTLAKLLGLSYQGDGTRQITRVSGWSEADSSSLVFLEHGARTSSAATTRAACVIAPGGMVPAGSNAILSDTPKLDFVRASRILVPRPRGGGLRSPSAVVDPSAVIGDDVDMGAHVTVGREARVGRESILHAGVVVGSHCVVGEQCILHPRVVLYPGAEVGSRVILHAGVVVGSDGFGYVFDGQAQQKFPQIGRVVIEDDVEIGANTTIDRGSLGTTRVGAGTKIDNLVQIAHNVQIGRGVVIAAQTGISGSTVIEDLAVIGGQVGFGDHARVEKGAVIGSKAGVLPGKIVRGGEVYWGIPVRPLKQYKRLNALFGRLPALKADVENLKKTVDRLREKIEELLGKHDHQ